MLTYSQQDNPAFAAFSIKCKLYDVSQHQHQSTLSLSTPTHKDLNQLDLIAEITFLLNNTSYTRSLDQAIPLSIDQTGCLIDPHPEILSKNNDPRFLIFCKVTLYQRSKI